MAICLPLSNPYGSLPRLHYARTGQLMNNTDEQDRLLSPRQAADHLGLTPRFLEMRRYRGDGPRFVSISKRCVRYRASDLREWVAERVRSSTSDPGGDAT